MPPELKILDCTIRDGGHLNKWRFDVACVKEAYQAARKAGADYFEVGYRIPEDITGYGPFAYCRDDLLREIVPDKNQRCRLLVMIDAGRADASLFGDHSATSNVIRGVRVAAYPYELSKATRIVEELHDKGYEVFLNLMAASELGADEYGLLAQWGGKELVSAVCFADSFGSMVPSDLPPLVQRLQTTGFPNVGFHAHNNLQLAFANGLRAVEAGACLLDASIFGMGRGAGNLPIEILVGHLERIGAASYNVVPYLDVIDRWFTDLFSEIGWGYSLQALLGGLANIHPYYVRSMCKNDLFTIDEVYNGLRFVRDRCPLSFSESKMEEALEKRFYTPLTEERAQALFGQLAHELAPVAADDAKPAGSFALANRHPGRRFLIMGTGPSLLKCHDEIEAFRKSNDCISIGVNHLRELFSPEYHVFVSRKRFVKYAGSIASGSTLLVPSFFGEELVRRHYDGSFEFFDIEVPCDESEDPVAGSTQKCLGLNVAVSAILAAYMMGASEIFAVGLDGYVDELNKQLVYFYNEDNHVDNQEHASLRYELLASELARINAFLHDKGVPFSIVTPTSHKKYYRAIERFV